MAAIVVAIVNLECVNHSPQKVAQRPSGDRSDLRIPTDDIISKTVLNSIEIMIDTI